MGSSLAYMEEPNRDVASHTDENNRIKFAVGEMQGWRLNMVSTNQPTRCKSDETKQRY